MIHVAGATEWERYDVWDMEMFWQAIGWGVAIMVIFGVIEIFVKKYRKQKVQ